MNKEKLLALCLPILFLIMGCLELPSQPNASASPSETSVPPVIETNTPVSNWAADFAEPILVAMKDRPPDYQDDFNNSSSGWAIADNVDYLDGDVGYKDGEYFVVADPLTDPAEASHHCAWGIDDNRIRYADFLAEFDVKFLSGKEGNWNFTFHRTKDGLNSYATKYAAGGNYQGGVFFNKCNSALGTDCTTLKEISDGSLIVGTDWVHIQVMARGPKMALYVDGKPALYVEDPNYTEAYNQGEFMLVLCNSADLTMEVRWDNLRVWDITGLP
ncbi:MAG: hypothetical protein Q7T89_17995 [Anaerolineales bacterium]|nr:hypothetical protein [Anaerolineales bacterium]